MTLHEQVREFHVAMGQPIVGAPAVPDHERVKLRFALIHEEFEEVRVALGVNHYGAQVRTTDIVQVAKEITDLMYVLQGTLLEFGIDGDPVAAEVHRSNLSKLVDGSPVMREDGKILKGPNYSPPDIAGELRKQGWRE